MVILISLNNPSNLFRDKSNPDCSAKCLENLKDINKAYDILSDPISRKNYDEVTYCFLIMLNLNRFNPSTVILRQILSTFHWKILKS